MSDLIDVTKQPVVEINITPNVYGSSVKIDGVEIKWVRRITVDAEVEKVSVVTLEIIAQEVRIAGQAETIHSVIAGVPQP